MLDVRPDLRMTDVGRLILELDIPRCTGSVRVQVLDHMM